MHGHLSVIKLLVENSADLSLCADCDTALDTALVRGHQDTISYLLSIDAPHRRRVDNPQLLI